MGKNEKGTRIMLKIGDQEVMVREIKIPTRRWYQKRQIKHGECGTELSITCWYVTDEQTGRYNLSKSKQYLLSWHPRPFTALYDIQLHLRRQRSLEFLRWLIDNDGAFKNKWMSAHDPETKATKEALERLFL